MADEEAKRKEELNNSLKESHQEQQTRWQMKRQRGRRS